MLGEGERDGVDVHELETPDATTEVKRINEGGAAGVGSETVEVEVFVVGACKERCWLWRIGAGVFGRLW